MPRLADDPLERIIEVVIDVVFAEIAKANHAATHVAMRDLAEEICAHWHRHYAGRYVPKGTRAANALRKDRVRELAMAGTPLDQLARDFHLTPGAVRRIVNTGNEREPSRPA